MCLMRCKKTQTLDTSDHDEVQSIEKNESVVSNLNPLEQEKLRLKLSKLVKIEQNLKSAPTPIQETTIKSECPPITTLKQLKRHELKKSYASLASLF